MVKNIDKSSPIPLYIQLESVLRNKISNKLGVNAPLGTIKELCKRYDVSAITVKRALKELANAGIINRIKSKGNFVLKQPSLKSDKKIMGFVSNRSPHRLLNPMYAKIFEGAHSVLSKKDMPLYFHSTPVTALEKITSSNNMIGFILAGVCDYRLYEAFIGVNTNFVLVDVSSNIFPSVLTDNERGGKLATEYLIKQGHKNIAIFNGNLEDETFKGRFDGYKKALKKHNIKLRDDYVMDALRILPNQRKDCISKLLNTKPKPTAIFFTADEYAFGFMLVLKELSIRVPEDMSVIGYNDVEESSHTEPSLTTIKQPMFEIGQRAACMLIDMSNEQKTNKFKPVLIAPELIERESCRKLRKIRRKKEERT